MKRVVCAIYRPPIDKISEGLYENCIVLHEKKELRFYAHWYPYWHRKNSISSLRDFYTILRVRQ